MSLFSNFHAAPKFVVSFEPGATRESRESFGFAELGFTFFEECFLAEKAGEELLEIDAYEMIAFLPFH